jgi:hypothetical protein
MKKLLLLCLLSLTLSPLSATNFYIDATNGDDTNDGLTPATAWQTLQSIQAVTFNPAPGDSILLKRGETWRGDDLQANFISTADAPLFFTNYGAASDSLPIISAISILTGSDQSANWTEVSPNIWALDLDFNPNRILLEGTEVLVANELDELGATDGEIQLLSIARGSPEASVLSLCSLLAASTLSLTGWNLKVDQYLRL